MAQVENVLNSAALWDSKGQWQGLTPAQAESLGPLESALYKDCEAASVRLQEAEATCVSAEQHLLAKVRELRAAERLLAECPGKPDRISLVREMINQTQSGG